MSYVRGAAREIRTVCRRELCVARVRRVVIVDFRFDANMRACVSERRARVFLLDVQTRRGGFETQTQPKDVFELFEEKRRSRAIAQGATARRRKRS